MRRFCFYYYSSTVIPSRILSLERLLGSIFFSTIPTILVRAPEITKYIIAVNIRAKNA